MIYAVHQPHYLPYPGYLAKVALADEFVFLERVQFVKREWQNRNRVKSPEGPVWLTVPVRGGSRDGIHEMILADDEPWRAKHIETLRRFYARAEHADELDRFAEIIEQPHDTLAQLTVATTSFFLDRFGIATRRRLQEEFEPLGEDASRRIVEIGQRLGADTYLAGAGGRDYMDLAPFEAAGIEVRFFAMPGYRYPQQHGEFVPHLGSVDLLANAGPGGFDEHIRPELPPVGTGEDDG
jgi:hypothetical protein